MKVLDPQSALLTNAEVHDFLNTNKIRRPDKRIGAYEPINLKEYHNVRQDFDRYIKLTAPHVAAYPPPDTYMNDVVQRLRRYGLTKTEALMILNLGIGLDRSQLPKVNGVSPSDTSSRQDENADAMEIDDKRVPAAATISSTVVPPEVANVETSESYHHYLLSRVVENMEERFQGEEGEQKIQRILGLLKECIPIADQHDP